MATDMDKLRARPDVWISKSERVLVKFRSSLLERPRHAFELADPVAQAAADHHVARSIARAMDEPGSLVTIGSLREFALGKSSSLGGAAVGKSTSAMSNHIDRCELAAWIEFANNLDWWGES